MPDDAITKLQAKRLEKFVIINVQRKDFAILHIIPDLPANAAVRLENANQFRQQRLLLCQVFP